MSEELTDAQKAFWEKARKGVLQQLNDQGGQLSLAEMHDFSLNKYFIQHQRFSQMMETFVNEGLVDFDHADQIATITDAGKDFIQN